MFGINQNLSINSKNKNLNIHESGNKLNDTLQMSILDTVSKKQYVFISLLPMYICVILGTVYPNLIGNLFFFLKF